MFGLVVLALIGVYFLISILVVRGAIKHARTKGKSTKLWGWGAALGMYLLVFWDWIPMVAVQQFYCAKDSGFWVYKTLDQWKAENPGVAETLVANDRVVSGPNYYVLNQRFDWVIRQTRYFPLNYMMREEWQVVDSKTDEVLARYVNFSASHERQQAGWSGWKFWLGNPHCINSGRNQDAFRSFRDKFREAKK